MTCKIADFGVARIKIATEKATNVVGTANWTAPEVLRQEPINERSDIYSFGCVVVELATNDVPWGAKTTLIDVFASVAVNRQMPPVSSTVDAFLRTLFADCCRNVPSERPSAATLVTRIEEHMQRAELRDALLTSDVDLAPALVQTASKWTPIANDPTQRWITLKDGKTGRVPVECRAEFAKLEALVHGALKGQALTVTSAVAIDNKTLSAAFASDARKLEQRMRESPNLFAEQKWRQTMW